MSIHSFNGIRFVVTSPLRPVEAAELESAERRLGCRFPSDYRDFVLRFGPGEFEELSLRVFSPTLIFHMTPDDRVRFSKHWFWMDSPDVWTQERAVESIACFDGSGGDDIRFHPADSRTIYLLPHGDTVIHKFTCFADIVRHFQREFTPESDRLIFTQYGACA